MVDAISRLTAILESSVERVNGRYQERTLHSFSALKRARSSYGDFWCMGDIEKVAYPAD